MKIGKRSLKKKPGRRVDELHRSPTRFELFRAWIERIPKVRLYIGLTALTWLSLTALIGIGPRPLIERVIAQGIIDPSDRTRLESLDLLQQADPWMALIGVGIVVAAEMWIAWYFLERFGQRILKTNSAIKLVLAASLTVLFTALARFFIELDFDPYLTPLAGLSIIGTMLLGPRLMFLMVVITSVNIGILSGNNFLLTAALLLGSGFAIYTTVRVESRQRLLKAGLVIAAVMGVVTFAVGLIGGGHLQDALWMCVSQMATADQTNGERHHAHNRGDEAARALGPPPPPARQPPAQRARHLLPLDAGRSARGEGRGKGRRRCATRPGRCLLPRYRQDGTSSLLCGEPDSPDQPPRRSLPGALGQGDQTPRKRRPRDRERLGSAAGDPGHNRPASRIDPHRVLLP